MATNLSQEETRIINEALFEKISSRDPLLEKEAIDAVNDFTRIQMREEGILRKVMPPISISNDDLDRQVDTDKPVKIVDKEPDSPAAISVGFATLPMNLYIRGQRYRVTMDRILTPRFTKDVDELRTWVMDIRQVLSDNAVKDMMAEEDSKFFDAVDVALVGAGTALPTSGVAQYQQIPGGITRDSLVESLKIMPSTPFSLEVHTVVLNHITIKDYMKFGRDEMGGDLSVDVLRDGWSETTFRGVRHIVTIKKDIVATNHEYQFADPKFIGKHYQLEDTTMYIRREAYMLEFFAYETSGCTIGHTGGIGHVHYTS